MIPKVLTLNFNPETAGDEIRKVFDDDLARLLWLAIKSSHVVARGFNAGCLRYAETLRRIMEEKPLTAERLLLTLGGVPGHGILGLNELAFATELLPFVNGTKKIGLKIGLEIIPR